VTQPPEDPGCCYGNPAIGYSARWMEECKKFGTESECTMLTNGDGEPRCVFEPLGEYEDCETVWPTTTQTPTEPAGCCYGDSYKANGKCARATSQSKCEDMGCSFLVTDDYSDCEMTTTSTPTTTAEVGCCKGDSAKTNAMCNSRLTRAQCDRSSSCSFIVDGTIEDECFFPPTAPPEEPGCCYGNPDVAYSKRWQDQCTTYATERECLLLTDGEGNARCVFEPMNEYMDCAMLWPTTTTTTEAPGCCYGSSYKAQAKCLGLDRAMCERKGCEFLETENEDDCILTTTESPTTTVIPGCCKGTSRTSNDACNAIEDADQCDRRSSCTFIAFGVVEEDCQFPVTQPPEDPGCCYGNPAIGYSARWMEECKKFGTESECTMLTNGDGEPRCVFEPLGEYEDCETVWPTTTQTPTEPAGCCYSEDSYKANDKCARATSQSKCESMGCSFLVTDDYSDCEMTTTSTPTTTTEVGCCYGEGVKENEMCGNKVGRAQCERNDACEFRSGADADCSYTETTDTIEPGCCYGDTAKTNEMCAEKETRDQCERSGKCEFRSGIDADCELPTTTSEPWLGAKSEDEAVLFANGANSSSVVSEAMNTQISLSTLLLLAVAAIAALQIYRCYAANADRDGYTKLATVPNEMYQTA